MVQNANPRWDALYRERFGSVIQETEDRLLYVKEREGQVDFWVSWTEGATGRMLYTCPEGFICDEMGTASYSDKPTEEKDDCSNVIQLVTIRPYNTL